LYTLLSQFIPREVFLLSSSKFPRYPLAAALFIPLLLSLDLYFVHSTATCLLLANSLEVAMILLATFCSLQVALRSSGYPRQLWVLLTIALVLVSLAQAISAYYQSFVPGSAHSPWPSDVLFFAWATPAFMILLPRSDDEISGIDPLRLFDFLQIAILCVTVYVYFFYSPPRWKTDQPTLLRQILVLYLARDFLLSSCFFVRARSSRSEWLRKFSFSLAAVFFAAVLSDAAYLFTLSYTVGTATWADLVWMLPFFLLTLFAIAWEAPQAVPSLPATSAAGNVLANQVLPVSIPLLVILMAHAIAGEQMLFAWLSVSVSILCSSIRLVLTNRRQHRISENLLSTERALRSSEEVLSTAFRNSPDAFSINRFPNGPYIELNDGYTRLTGYSREEALGKTPREMNLWVDAARRDEALAVLRSTGHLRDFEFRFRTKSGQMRIGQMSASVVEIRGERCSLVIVRDVTERKEAEEILRSSEERFRVLVRDLYFAVVLYGPDARVEFANRAAHRLFNIPDGAAVGKQLADLGIVAVSEDGQPIPFHNRPVSTVLRTRQAIRDSVMAFRVPGSDQLVWIFGSAVPQFDANGNIVRVISSFADVTEMKNAERAIHNLSTQLLKLQDEERRRLGRELHDGLAQTVLAINLNLAQVRQSLSSANANAVLPLEKARSLTREMSRDIRTLSYLLHPPLLDDLGLFSTLKEYIQGFSERSGIDTQLQILADFDRLSPQIELALFRIVQESLANIQRHSGSPTALIRLTSQDSALTLEVIDHGHGMPEIAAAFRPEPRASSGTPQATPSQVWERGLDRGEESLLGSSAQKREVPHSADSAGNEELRSFSASRLAVPSNEASFGASAPEGSSTTPPTAPSRLGVGIPGMHERIAQLGGHLSIISGPTGTTIRATISLPAPVPTETANAHFDRG
jgi:PAS domain S-box-containing protein